MKKVSYIFLFIGLSAFTLQAQGITASSGDIFAKANATYEMKKFSEAQILYQQLADAGYSSKELFYNLANTYYKMKKYGYAVYYYEKAKKLDPSDEDILFNLELTQIYLKDKIVTPPDFIVYELAKKIMYLFSVNTWAVWSIVGWYLFVGMLLMKKILHAAYTWFRILFIITGICFLFSAVNFGANVYTDAKVHEVVILNPLSDVKSEPDNNATILFVLHEGAKVQIRTERNDWLEIKLKDGKVGWIRKDDAGAL